MSALLMCVVVKISVTVSSKLIAECSQLKCQVEAGSKSCEGAVQSINRYSHVLFHGGPEGLH